MFGLVQVRLYTESELENSPRTLKPSKINSAPRLGGATGTTCIVRCECVCSPSIATAPCMRVEGGRASYISFIQSTPPPPLLLCGRARKAPKRGHLFARSVSFRTPAIFFISICSVVFGGMVAADIRWGRRKIIKRDEVQWTHQRFYFAFPLTRRQNFVRDKIE